MKSLFLLTLLLYLPVSGQLVPSEILAKDQAITEAQSVQIFKIVRAVTKDASEIVFPIFSNRNHIGYGVSVGDGKLIAKASEVVPRPKLLVKTKEGALPASILGAYPEQDLVLLSVEGLKAPAAKWADGSGLPEGAFLAAVRPDGEAAGFGVKSVAARSLRAEDQGFLGVEMHPNDFGDGVKINRVVRDSAAAMVGLRPGDEILAIKGEAVKGFHEISARLRRLKAGETVDILISRNSNEFKVRPTLQGSREKEPESEQLRAMNSKSGSRNQVRDNFGNVVQSDMELESSQTGLPIIDLEGRIVGLVIARAGRISTLILPSIEIEEMLKSGPYKLDRRPRSVSERSRR